MSTLSTHEIANMRGSINATLHVFTCVISGRTETGRDADGQPVYAWAQAYSGPCWYDASGGREAVGADATVLVVNATLRLPANTPVSAGHRVDSITDPDGDVVVSGANIEAVFERLAETVCALEGVA